MYIKFANDKVWMTLYLVLFSTVGIIQAAVSTCNAKLQSASGTFTSPNYPDPPRDSGKSSNSTAFPDNGDFVTCAWEIVVPRGKGIQLKFGDFDMRAALDDCDQGEVEVFSGVGKAKSSLDKYCPGNAPDTVTLRNNSASVVFRRPLKFNGRGFLISFVAISPGETIDDFVTCSATGELHVEVESFSVMCPSGCAGIKQITEESEGVWGNLQYRDNSRLCQSAVHAGVISDAFGGRVRVRREPGKVLYIGTPANNITAQTGAMSDFMIFFPDVRKCHNEIDFKENQLSASSFWNTTRDYKNQEWLPQKAILTSPAEAWSPDDPTTEQWLQVDLRRIMNITGMVTKGSAKPYAYTKGFRIKHSLDNITWDWYKETGMKLPKVFEGNQNFFAKVRNSFIRPTILAKHFRIYPTEVKELAFRYGLKFSLVGCKPSGHFVTPTPLSTTTKTTASTTKTSASTSITSTTITSTILPKTDNELHPLMKPDHVTATNTTAENNKKNATAGLGGIESPVGIRPNTVDGTAKVGPGDLNEKSIIIIAIVAALAVTSILLAALVLILVRKSKKEPMIGTMVPKHPTSRTNATYNSGIDMRYLTYNDNHGMTKKQKKTSKKNKKQIIEFKNDNYKEGYSQSRTSSVKSSMTNSRGGVTLSYDHQQRQPMMNGDLTASYNGSTLPLRTSYSANSDVPGPSILHAAGGQIVHGADTDSFISDDEDHEYQVIPDPVDDHISKLLPKSSGSSIEGHSKNFNSFPREHGTMWGTAGDGWGKDTAPSTETGHMASFAPPNLPQNSHRSRAGTCPHPIHFATREDVVNPVFSPGHLQSAPANSFTQPRFSSRRNRKGSRSPPISSTKTTYNTPQRYSSSSNGSSHSPFDVTSSLCQDHSAPYYASVPEGQEHSSCNRNQQHPVPIKSRKPSYNYPNNNSLETHSFSTQSSSGNVSECDAYDHNIRSNGLNGSSHGPPSRSFSFNHAKMHSGYDQLYRSKTASGQHGEKCIVAMTMNDYHQLDLNTPV